MEEPTQYLFAYGTLQLPLVQMANFGRLLKGTPDTLVGYNISEVEITDADVLAQSEQKFHPILRFSGKLYDEVKGMAFEVSELDVERADRYEVADYQRVAVTLLSGREAWVYIERDEPPP
jgi:Gamma-glutamyl cyclotransferase, AIG2-like